MIVNINPTLSWQTVVPIMPIMIRMTYFLPSSIKQSTSFVNGSIIRTVLWFGAQPLRAFHSAKCFTAPKTCRPVCRPWNNTQSLCHGTRPTRHDRVIIGGSSVSRMPQLRSFCCNRLVVMLNFQIPITGTCYSPIFTYVVGRATVFITACQACPMKPVRCSCISLQRRTTVA